VANDKRFVVKNGLEAQNVKFVDSAQTGDITVSMIDSDTLSFSGTAGQLFSITDSLTGTIFSVNDISGIPSIEVDDDGTVRLAEFAGNVLIGTDSDDGTNKLQVNGTVSATFLGDLTGNVTGNASTASTLETARTISLGGVLSGSASFDGSSNITITAAHTSDPTITLTGAVTGTGTMTNLGNVSITTTHTADPTLTLAGDLTGSATFTNLGNATLTATIAANSVALGTDTTGNYAGSVVAGNAITVNGTAGEGTFFTVNHADTSTQASVNNSNGTVIQDVTLDTYGHVTGLTSLNLDSRYYTETEADSRFVNVTGDTMTGDLTLDSGHDLIVDSQSGVKTSGSWIRATTGSGYIDLGPANTSYAHIYTDRPEFYFNKNLRVLGDVVWTAGNDGAGTGLDADLLDGQHGSYYTGYTDTAISNLINSAPGALDTLNELAAALGDDPNFATTVTNSLATKADKTTTISAGTGLTGGGDLSSNRTIQHADTSSQASVNNSNGTVIQDVTLDGFGHVTGLGSVNLDSRYVNVTGDTMSGDLTISKADAKIRLYDNSGTSGNNPFIEWDTTANQGIKMELNVYDGELPEAGYGLVVGPSTTNAQWPTTGDLSFSVLGEIYAGSESLSTVNRVFHDGYHPNADKWTTARTLSLTGAVTGSVSIDGSGNVSLATTATSDPTITLTGAVTGSGTMTNLGNVSITTTATADPTLTLTGDATGSATFTNLGNASLAVTVDRIDGVAFRNTNSGGAVNADTLNEAGHTYYNAGVTNFSGNATDGALYSQVYSSSWQHQIAGDYRSGRIAVRGKNNGTWQSWQSVFSDNYHPNADKWTTARTLSLTGDVTGSTTWDGSGNASITATVANDSHNHSSSSGNFTVGGDLTVSGGQVGVSTASTRHKYSLYGNDASYAIGMQSAITYGGLNDWAMTFQFNNEADRGFWWGDVSHTTAQGAMALTTGGLLTVASGIRVGYGEADTTTPSAGLQVSGNISVTGTVDGRDVSADGSKLDGIEAGATADQTITAGGGLTGGGTGNVTISHADTSAQGSVNNSNGTVIQDITLDTYGHITSLASVNLDGRYYTETEADSRFVNVTGDTMTGALTMQAPIVIDQNGNNGNIAYEVSGGCYIPRPLGGSYKTATSSITGSVAVKLPTQSWNQSDMLSFWVDIFDYAGNPQGESVSLHIYGYQYSTGNWTNVGALVLSDRTDRDYNVRFGHDGTRHIVYIGETNSTWSYPQVNVRDFQAGYNASYANYDDAFAVTFETSHSNIQNTASNNYPVAKQFEVARNIALSGAVTGNANFDGSGNITISTTATSDPTLTINGDISGSATFTNLGNATLTANIAANVVGANELNVSGNGTAGQVLKSDGDGSFTWIDAGGGIQFSRKTSNYTAVVNEGIIADTTSGTWTLTLPSAPATGDQVIVADGGSWAVTNLTIGRNGKTIEGVADNYLLDVTGAQVQFIYDGTTWQVYSNPGIVHSNDSLTIYNSTGTALKTIYSA
jgi:hypothetical protein